MIVLTLSRSNCVPSMAIPKRRRSPSDYSVYAHANTGIGFLNYCYRAG